MRVSSNGESCVRREYLTGTDAGLNKISAISGGKLGRGRERWVERFGRRREVEVWGKVWRLSFVVLCLGVVVVHRRWEWGVLVGGWWSVDNFVNCGERLIGGKFGRRGEIRSPISIQLCSIAMKIRHRILATISLQCSWL